MSVDFAFIARSVVSLEARARASELARSDVPVLIIGPDGSGRKHLAEFIHCQSPRRAGPCQSLDCDLQIESLWPSRLYGHVAGAIPGAATDRVGLLESTAGGTLLLREIDRAPRDLQAHLQHVLEDRTFTRLGEERPLSIGCRVIATAMSSDFEASLHPGLRSVLAGAIIRLLPLSQRSEDIPPLIEHFLAVYSAQHGKRLRMPEDAVMANMCQLPWVGNVQELESAIDCAVQLANDEDFSTSLLPDSIRGELDNLASRLAELSVTPITFSLEDVTGQLLAQVEDLTIRILDGGLTPVPAASVRCDRAAVEQPLIREILGGTLRACRKLLVQSARDVKSLGEKATLSRLGLDDPKNPIHQALAVALRPTFEEIMNVPEGAELALGEVMDAPVGGESISYSGPIDAYSRPQVMYRLPSATFEAVCQCYELVVNRHIKIEGRIPNRDRLAKELTRYLGRNVSTGLVSKVKKHFGKDRKRSPRLKKMGIERAEEIAALREHKDLVAFASDFVTESDRKMDEDFYRDKLRRMSHAELACEAGRLYISLPLPEDEVERFDQFVRANTIFESLKESDLDALQELAQTYAVSVGDLDRQGLIAKLLRAVMQPGNGDN